MTALGRIDLNSLLVFDAVVDTGGFTAAAERLGVAKAKVSIQIRRLEAQLGTALLIRTTRQVTLTEAGRALHRQCQPLLRGLHEALDQVGTGHAPLSGMLRVSTTVDYAVQSLAPVLARFAALHPDLQVDLRTGDRIIDLGDAGIDLSIRIGWLRDSSQRAVKLGEFEQYVVASPAYLHRTGRPVRPQELAEREWIALTLLPTPLTWRFAAPAGDLQTVQVRSRVRVDSPGALRSMLRAGAGISVLDQYSAQPELDAGHLVRVLEQWALPRGGVYAVLPPGRHVPPKVRAFLAFFQDSLKLETRE